MNQFMIFVGQSADKRRSRKWFSADSRDVYYPIQKFQSDLSACSPSFSIANRRNGSSPAAGSSKSSTNGDPISANISRTSSPKQKDAIYMLEAENAERHGRPRSHRKEGVSSFMVQTRDRSRDQEWRQTVEISSDRARLLAENMTLKGLESQSRVA